MTEKPNSVCKWCRIGLVHQVCEPVAEPAEPSVELEDFGGAPYTTEELAEASAELTAEGPAYHAHYHQGFAAHITRLGEGVWDKSCPDCQSAIDRAARPSEPAAPQPVAVCEGITVCTQKEACLRANRCLINLPQPVAGEGPLRISFDIGGVLSKYPEAFRPMVDALQRGGAHVYVITDMHEHEKSVRFVRDNGYDIPAERILNSDYTSHGEGCKAETIKQHGIKIHLDDFAGYCAHTECVSLFVWPNPSKPYYADDFKTDGTEGDFGRRKAAKI